MSECAVAERMSRRDYNMVSFTLDFDLNADILLLEFVIIPSEGNNDDVVKGADVRVES